MNTRIVTLFAASLTSTLCIMPATANPVGGSVVGGDANATISGQGTANTTINQSANNVVINWQDFSIAAGEVTRFVQPSATASALNRVVSGNPSLIFGSLQANGRVFVINPNGILVGANGVIDTKGFVASTLNLSDANYLAGGDLIFSGNSAAGIRNEGAIQALGGSVFLIANSVENAGTISAPQGTVGLAAGSQVQIVQSGNEHLSVLAGNASGAHTGVDNSGTINATTAELKAAGGNIYALAINNGGVVRASGIVNKNGRIYLSATGGNIQNSGTLSAQNADGSGGTVVVDGGHGSTVTSSGTIEARGTAAGTKGGTVNILGDDVELTSGALVDVSGEAGGGTALVGGDYQGANPEIQNATRTTVDAGAEIRADALSSGDAGKVVVWADDTTHFNGTINARALGAEGQGGVAEISGRQHLSVGGHAYLAGANGAQGELLLDPGSVTIDDGANTAPGANLDVFHDAWVIDQLNTGGANLTISTANSLNAGTEDLTVLAAADVTWNSANGLILVGNNSVSLQGGSTIANAGSGGLTLQSGSGAVTLGGTVNMAGNVSVSSAGAVAINGNVTATAVTAQSGTDGSGNLSFGASVTVNADTQSYQAGDGNGGTGTATANLVGNTPTFRNTAGSAAPTTFTYRQDASIADADIPAVAQFGGTAPANYTIRSDDGSLTISTGAKLAGSALQLLAANALTINGSATLGSLVAHSGTDGSGDLSFGAGVTVNADSQSYQAGDGVGGGAAAVVDIVNNNPNFRATAGGTAAPTSFTIRQDASIADSALPVAARFGATTPGNYTIQSDEGDVTISTEAKYAGTALTASAAGTLTFSGAGALSVASLVANSAGAIAINKDITSQGSVISHSGTDGSGNTTFANITVQADSQSYQAGDGSGGTATALVNLTGNNPDFRALAGGANPPLSFTYRQDAAITSGNMPSATHFGGALPNALTLRSDDGTVQLGAMTVPGTLTVISHGNITQNGALTVNAGASTFTVDGVANADVLLGGQANHFGNQTVTINSINSGTVRDVSLRNADGTAAFPTLPTGLRNLTLAFDAAAITLPTLSLSGNLDVTAAGIAQSGILTLNGVGQTATFAGGSGNDITLDNNNDFNTVIISSGNNVTLRDTGALNLGNQNASGNLAVTAGGLVDFTGSGASSVGGTMGITTTAGGINDSGSGSLTVSGTATLNASGAGNDITLDNSANNFNTVAVVSGNNVTLRDAGAINLGNLNVGANLGVTAGGKVDFTGASASSLVGGTMGITTTSGGIDDSGSGAVTVTGTTTLSASGAGNDITLNNSHNFSTVAISSGRNVVVNDANDINLGAVTVSGTLGVTAHGNITQSGAISASSAASTFTVDTAVGADVLLGSQANHFANRTVTIATTGGGTIRDVSYRNADASAIFPTLPSGLRDLTLQFDAAGASLPTLSLTRNLSVTAAGLIDFTGAGVSTIGGTMGLTTTAGGITDSGSGSVTVSGTTTLAAGTANSVTLDNNNNDFNTVAVNSANNVTLRDANAINFGNLAVNGNLSVNAAGLVDFTGLGASTVGGTLGITTTAGGISDSGSGTLSVSGTATLAAGAANNITLDNAGNDFATVVISSANNTTLRDASAINLGTLAVSGNLGVTAAGLVDFTGAGASSVGGTLGITTTAGGINDSGAGNLTVSGVSTLAAGSGNDITLNNANNNFSTVAITSGRNVNLNDADAIVLGASTVSGTLNVTANGQITDSGNVAVTGAATLAAGSANNITLDNNDDFSTLTITSGNDVTVNDINSINLGASTVSGSLQVVAHGNITQSGALNVSNPGKTSTFTVDTAANGDVLLGSQANNFGISPVTISTANGGSVRDVSLRNINAGAVNPSLLTGLLRNLTLRFDNAAIALPGLTLSGALSVYAGGPVTQSGLLNVAGLQVSASGNVTLDTFNNQVGTVAGSVSGTGNQFKLNDQNSLTVGTVDGVSGLTTANGDIAIKADQMEIAQAINSGNANTTLEPLTPGASVSLGSEMSGFLSFTQPELNNITANVLTIGNPQVASLLGADTIITPPSVVQLVLISSGGTFQSFSAQLAALLAAGAVIPTPNVEANNFSGATIDAEAAAKILPPGSIGVLALQVPFSAEAEEPGKAEKISKWVGGKSKPAEAK